MGKRLRRIKPICSCISPRSSSLCSYSSFSCWEEDIWTEITKYLDGRNLVMLALTCKWFHRVVMEENVWKFACLRDLQVPDPGAVSVKWSKLYAVAFDGTHSYLFRQQEKQIDLQLVRCPVCDQNTCDGTMQTLDARHIELFLSEGFQDGTWDYTLLGCHETRKNVDGAIGAIFDLKHLRDSSSANLFDPKTWMGKNDDWQPKVMTTAYAVAVCTKLQPNDGLHVKYQVLRAGDDGKVMSIRISQQLL
ncbi:hypothetical protein Dimus_006639 [Dionaea muscipula]